MDEMRRGHVTGAAVPSALTYLVVVAADMGEFCNRVHKLQLEGWECQGGVYVLQMARAIQYFQAMVRDNL